MFGFLLVVLCDLKIFHHWRELLRFLLILLLIAFLTTSASEQSVSIHLSFYPKPSGTVIENDPGRPDCPPTCCVCTIKLKTQSSTFHKRTKKYNASVSAISESYNI